MNQTKNRNIVDDKDGIFCPVLCFSDFKNFSCGREDLDNFIWYDALIHKKELFAITYSYCLKKNARLSNPLAFISLSNDNILLSEKKRAGLLPDPVNYKSSPAVKIGRFGVDGRYQQQGFGSYLMDIVKKFFLTENRTGCRFITVDAYNDSNTIRFYKRNGFVFLSGRDRKGITRIMYFDLLSIPEDA